MTQAQEIFATITPTDDMEALLDLGSTSKGKNKSSVSVDTELTEIMSDADSMGGVETSTKKATKLAANRRRTQTKKKPFTEDSIRVYLQEIGRIRLLRAEEEIELARQIADLLDLEYIRATQIEHLGRITTDEEWAVACDIPNMRQFNLRLHIGRMAKDKMVQSNLRLVVSIAKKYMNRG